MVVDTTLGLMERMNWGGSLSEKLHKHNSGEVHRYVYDSAYRLVHYTQIQAHYV